MGNIVVAISLALTTALLPVLRASICPPGAPEGAASHLHAASEAHDHSGAHGHAHSDLHASVGASDEHPQSGDSCCRAAKGPLGAVSSSPSSPEPRRLAFLPMVPARSLAGPVPHVLRDARALVSSERASPFVRNRAPLLI